MEINDKIQTLQKSRWWDKGDIGRIVHKTYDSHDSVVYLVCFDSTCHKMHDRNVSMCGILDLMNVHYIDQID